MSYSWYFVFSTDHGASNVNCMVIMLQRWLGEGAQPFKPRIDMARSIKAPSSTELVECKSGLLDVCSVREGLESPAKTALQLAGIQS